MRKGHVPLLIVLFAVKVVDGSAFQYVNGGFADLVGGAVVDFEFFATAANVDAALAESYAMAVDTLVGVPHDEEIVFASGENGAKKAECFGAHVLCFVNNDGPIGKLEFLGLDHLAGVANEINEFFLPSLVELRTVLLEYGPNLLFDFARKARAAADARGG